MKFDWISGRLALLAWAALALTGCGGGGGGTSAAFTAASVGAGDDPKELAFTWSVNGNPATFRLEVNPDGASGFSPVDVDGDGDTDAEDEIAATRTSLDLPIPLHLTDFANALYQVVALDAGGNELDRSDELALLDIPIEQLIGYFKASNTESSDFFGEHVALSADGDTLAVGARQEDSAATGIDGDQDDDCGAAAPVNCAVDSGAVYVFTRDGSGSWSQQAYVKASNTDPGDNFGRRVALSASADTLAVGAPEEDSDRSDIIAGSPDDAAAGDLADDANIGAVYVFTRDGSATWSQQAYVKPSNADDLGDLFGGGVALSGDGDTLAVGAAGEDGGQSGVTAGSPVDGTTGDGAANAGAVYVFTRDGSGSWSQQAYVKASNTDTGDGFGDGVALSETGDTLAVGAAGEDGDQSGVTAGSPADGTTGDGAVNAGAVYVFTRDGSGSWSQQAYVKASNTDADDQFGYSVTLSGQGDTLAVGTDAEASSATGIDGDQSDNSLAFAGAVYVYTRDGSGTWSQQAYVKASNTDADDLFGESVALTADGATLAIGANDESSSATGVGGDVSNNDADLSGAAYLY